MTSLFISHGPTTYKATEITAGPWFPGAQHGGPPAALLMRAIEQADAPGPMQVARFTMELLGAVPVAMLDVEVRVRRPGRRIQLVEAALIHDGKPVATAAAWRMAYRPLTTPAAQLDAPPPPPPEALDVGFEHAMPESWGDGFHVRAVQKQVLVGSFDAGGPGRAWMRLVPSVVDDEVATPWQRVAAVADFGNGLASFLDPRHHLFINTDLTIGFGRVPQGEWVLLDAATTAGPDGMGLVSGRLADIDGTFGGSMQSLLIEER